ncbi:MAG TPA: cytochrome c-type biogenesis protein CcmH [Candidatus Dormibacteraeota bacterium]|nr:cytochrome c-type biogenesis protein CcmH [Candidatus Dormibacteraeota bacterium]
MIRVRSFGAVFLLFILGALPLLVTQVGAQQSPLPSGSDRAKQIGGKFMCMCSCNQVLTQCNHVGCTVSTTMLKEVDQAVKRGEGEDTITQALVQEFGTKVYAEPPKSGFSLVAWSLPSIYLAIGTVLVIFTIKRWRKRPVVQAAGPASSTKISPDMLDRARAQAARETQD